jgi:hypothetical protein
MKIKQFLFVFIIFTTYVISACAATGGSIGNLIPAPKFLKGNIENDIYTTQDKTFSIMVPHKSESYEYKYMQVKEQSSEYGAYVSFGPAAMDQSIYRVETGSRTSSSMSVEDAAPKIVEDYKSQLKNAYGIKPTEVSANQNLINGKKAYYWQLTQLVPAGKFNSEHEVLLTHHVYVIDFEKSAAIIWVQIPDTTSTAVIEPRAFAESLVMH